MANSGFTFCVQNEWQYVQRVVTDTAPFFSPLEEVILCMHFLPALLGVPSVEFNGEHRQLLTHSIKLGAGNPQPCGHCPECSHGLSCGGNLSPDSVPCGPCHSV